MYLKRTKEEILRQALHKLSNRTTITATSPGSVARTLVEILADDLGDFYGTLDFNLQQSMLSTATGRSLDLIGSMYNVKRKTLGRTAAVAAIVGSFYFYSDVPAPEDIVIPSNTLVGFASNDLVSRQYAFVTTDSVTLRQGRLRVYAPVVSSSVDSTYTAAPGTLVSHNFASPAGIIIRCTNPKPISPQLGQETDTDYRNRIISESRRQAGGTDLSLRMTSLAVNGVRNVQVINMPKGLGTVEVVVNAENHAASDEIVARVANALDKVRPVGVRLEVRSPDMIPLDVSVVVTTKVGTVALDAEIIQRVKNAILRYINTLSVGDPFVYNQMVSDVMGSMDDLRDVSFDSLRMNGSPIIRKNYTPKRNEHIIPGEISVLID